MPYAEVQLPTSSGFVTVEALFEGGGPSISLRVKESNDSEVDFTRLPLESYTMQESIFLDGCRYWKRWTTITDSALSSLGVSGVILIITLCLVGYTRFFS